MYYFFQIKAFYRGNFSFVRGHSRFPHHNEGNSDTPGNNRVWTDRKLTNSNKQVEIFCNLLTKFLVLVSGIFLRKYDHCSSGILYLQTILFFQHLKNVKNN